MLRLAKEGEIIERPEDILREPYIFEFAGLPQLPVYDPVQRFIGILLINNRVVGQSQMCLSTGTLSSRNKKTK